MTYCDQFRNLGILIFILFPIICFTPPETIKEIDLRHALDTVKICKNPLKGWYLHYFDNGVERYGDKIDSTDYLLDFPGLTHVYLRLAWSYLEPQEGIYNWEIIDKQIRRWTSKGYTIAFRITCKETAIPFATPEWVMKAGAKGEFYQQGSNNWEPDYGDPIFLQKLENFHKAFAARYDSKPWVEYMDIGSYGEWGEGHNAFSSKKDWPLEVIKKHIDIHKKYYKKSMLVISDDFIGSRRAEDGSKDEILKYILDNKIALRDDSVCVKYFADRFGFSTLRSKNLFDKFWEKSPTNLELEHYHATKEQDTWKEGKPFLAAIEEVHAPYAGFHGYPREWLSENPEFAKKIANKLGYWYTIEKVRLPAVWKKGESLNVEMNWKNMGVAPAYQKFSLIIALMNKKDGKIYPNSIEDSGNLRWVPGKSVKEKYLIKIPSDLPVGEYQLSLTLSFKKFGSNQKNIDLALKNQLQDEDGLFRITTVKVSN